MSLSVLFSFNIQDIGNDQVTASPHLGDGTDSLVTSLVLGRGVVAIGRGIIGIGIDGLLVVAGKSILGVARSSLVLDDGLAEAAGEPESHGCG